MTQPPRLLVSVRSVGEAREALAGGCDILDVKEPANGALGMAGPSVIAEIAANVRLTAADVPVSAALGELREWETQRTSFPLSPELTFAKLGLAGMRGRSDWRALWDALRGRFHAAASWVAVVYADDEPAQAPPPLEVVVAAAEAGCRIVLIDTFTKDGRSLLDFQSPSELQAIATVARQVGLQLALGGSFRAALLPQIVDIAPDIVAIRSAACRGGARNANVCASAVGQFRRGIQEAWREPTRAPLT